MTFLPIVTRELRVASRRSSTYWLRSGAALAIIAAGVWLFLMMQNQAPRSVATGLFGVLTGGAVLFCLFSGVRSTADCLSEEKREGTLGLLFLTDLKGYDVVLGKLAATSVNAFYGILAVVPVMAIPLLMGGLSMNEVGRMALLAVNTLFFSLAIGMFVSSMARSSQRAMGTTFTLILLFALLFPLCAYLPVMVRKASQPIHWLYWFSPGFAYSQAFEATYRVPGNRFWASMAVIHGLSWLFLMGASLTVRHSWQDRPAGTKTLRWRDRWRSWSFGDLTERTDYRRLLLNQNAFFWLAARARLKPAIVWSFLGLVTLAWLWGLAKFRRDWLNEGMFLTTAVTLNFVLRSWFANEATRQLAEERKAGTLELLLSTPLGVTDILHGQWLALKRQFLGPVMVVLAVETLFMFSTLSQEWLLEQRAFWAALWISGMLMLIADLAALYWVGMWQALTEKNPARAFSASISRIFFVPWALYAMVMLLIVLASMSGYGQTQSPDWKFFLGLWFLLGLVVDFSYASYARHKLLNEFRLAAQQRYNPATGFWGRLLGIGRNRQANDPP
ncbi:MAG TPA: ABC transporter permease [Clostridia bacterium]|nr:ABC transporter permease [Clostridia bacterium]